MNDLRLKIVDVDGYFALYNDVTSLSIGDGVMEIKYEKGEEDGFLLSVLSSIMIYVTHNN